MPRAKKYLENHFSPFRHIQEQRAIVALLQDLPTDTIVATIRLPLEYGAIELSLLSDRLVLDFAIGRDVPQGPDGPPVPQYFLTFRFARPNDVGLSWVAGLGAPLQEVRGYRFYEMHPGVLLPSAEDVLLDPHLYRFSPERLVSLS